MASPWYKAIFERLGWPTFRDNVLDRRVPTTPWYYGDGASLLLLFGVQVVTGMFLVPSYTPSLDSAYHSVQYITHEQALGWLVRALHYWSGGLMVVMLIVHLFREILVAGYKAPREVTWLSGVCMFFLIIAMSYSGYVLRWDERGIYAVKVLLNMLYYVPWIGEGLVLFVQGGPDLGSNTLSRMFALHVIFIPMMLLALIGFHQYLVILHGVTSRPERKLPVKTAEEQQKVYEHAKESPQFGEVFFPETVAKSGAMAIAVFLFAVSLAVLLGPAELMPEANLVEPAEPAEEWWFWWYSALIALLPPGYAQVFVVAFPIGLFLVLMALPFVDRSSSRGLTRRPLAIGVVVLCVLALVILTDLRRRSAWTGRPGAGPPPVPPQAALSSDVETGRLLFAQFGCTSCHAVGGHGAQVAVDLASLSPPRSHQALREYILQPPPGVAMPAYVDQLDRGRLTDEQLEQIVGFCLVAQTFPLEY